MARTRLHNLALLRTQPSYRTRTVVRVFAFLGGLATVREILSQAGSARVASYAQNVWLLLAAVVLGAVAVLVATLPSDRYTFRHAAFRSEIHMEAGDLLGVPDDVVVLTANRHFDSISEDHYRGEAGAKISRGSLIAQLGQRWYPQGDGHEIARMITSQTGVEAGAVEHPVGTIVELRGPAGQHVLLLAVSRRGEKTMSEVLIDDIWTALSALWASMRINAPRSAALPVIGSGYANTQVGSNPLLMLMITSYTTAAMEDPVGPIRIMVRDSAHDLETFELAQSYCESMGFKTRRR
jgi:hypothetical protein